MIVKSITEKTPNVAITAISRLENDYIIEWINHHINLGFNHIYIYDNSFGQEDRLEKVIDKKYSDTVTIIPAYDKYAFQKQAYENAYHVYGKYHDYMLFIDIDEFISLQKHNTIQDYLNSFESIDFESLRIHWDIYDDNDIIERDITKPVTESFTRKGTTNKCLEHNFSTKCLLKTKINDMFFPNVHFGRSRSRELKTIIGNGQIIPSSSSQMIKNRQIGIIKINHYVTKSISEYMNQKLKRGDADGFIVRNIENRFFIYCNKNKQKLDYYNSHTSHSYIMQNNDIINYYHLHLDVLFQK